LNLLTIHLAPKTPKPLIIPFIINKKNVSKIEQGIYSQSCRTEKRSLRHILKIQRNRSEEPPTSSKILRLQEINTVKELCKNNATQKC